MTWTKRDSSMLLRSILAGAIFVIAGYFITEPVSVNQPYELPPSDPGRRALYRCLYTNKWVYEDDRVPASGRGVTHRANDSISLQELDNRIEEIIKKTLEDNVKDYRKETYWGEVPH